MRTILVATDFSARSDRAIRRATLLAKTHEATLNLVHVIDEDRPKRIVDPEREAALALLNEQAQSLREHDGVDCSARVVLGKLADEIVEAAQQTAADLVIVGSHRHNGLQDVSWGTTAERTIRPVLKSSMKPTSRTSFSLLRKRSRRISSLSVLMARPVSPSSCSAAWHRRCRISPIETFCRVQCYAID
jgi:nucleotide-binding universal stress UspA family protein